MTSFPGPPRRNSSLGAPSFAQSYFTSPSAESLLAPSTSHSCYASAKSTLSPSEEGHTAEDDEESDDRSLHSLSTFQSTSTLSRDDFNSYSQTLDAGFLATSLPAPPSPSHSFASSSSSDASSAESAMFQLSSPFPRPQVSRPPPARVQPRLRTSSAAGKENLDHPTPQQPPLNQNRSTNRLRLNSKSSASGFPYAASSVLVASNAFISELTRPDLAKTVRRSGPGARGEASGEGAGDRSSSELDLDLSFEHPHGSTSVESSFEAASGKPVTTEWVGISMAGTSNKGHHGVPEGELVRSPSGRLLGTRKRVRSAIELRAAYVAGEETAVDPPRPSALTIFMDGARTSMDDKSLSASQSTLRPFLLSQRDAAPPRTRRMSVHPAVVAVVAVETLSSSSRDTPSPRSTSSLTSGFAYNPTDPLLVPLPDSPAFSSSPDGSPSDKRRSSKHFPLPLTLVDKRNPGEASPSPQLSSSSSSPGWGITSFFRRQQQLPPSEGPILTTYDEDRGLPSPAEHDQFIVVDGGDPRSRGPQGWADDLTKSTLQYLGMKRRGPPGSPSASSPAASPTFDVNSPIESDGTAQTGATSPGMSPIFGEQDGVRAKLLRDQAMDDWAHGRSSQGRRSLAGLGLDLDASCIAGPSSRPHHTTIPSLSISPPPGSRPRDDTNESDSGESALDPHVSPSRRLSRVIMTQQNLPSSPSQRRRPTSSSHKPRGTSSSISSSVRPGYFGPPPRNLLISETMPGARLPHQTSLSSSRFSFAPAPLSLVQDELLRSRGYDPISQFNNRYSSRTSSIKSGVVNSPSSSVFDRVVPAKLLFLLGLLLGPWCWIIGGWYLRSLDGEQFGTTSRRCREPKCGCGHLVQWYSLATTRQHRGSTTIHLWKGVDQWVFINRVAAISSSFVVVTVVGVALRAATATI